MGWTICLIFRLWLQPIGNAEIIISLVTKWRNTSYSFCLMPLHYFYLWQCLAFCIRLPPTTSCAHPTSPSSQSARLSSHLVRRLDRIFAMLVERKIHQHQNLNRDKASWVLGQNKRPLTIYSVIITPCRPGPVQKRGGMRKHKANASGTLPITKTRVICHMRNKPESQSCFGSSLISCIQIMFFLVLGGLVQITSENSERHTHL